jgi:hypothetical protein
MKLTGDQSRPEDKDGRPTITETIVNTREGASTHVAEPIGIVHDGVESAFIFAGIRTKGDQLPSPNSSGSPIRINTGP